MPAAMLVPPVPGDLPPRKRFTRAEVRHMIDAGLFAGQRYELIDGDLIDKMGQNPPHSYALQLLLSLFGQMFGTDRIRIQSPIEVAVTDQERSEPEPDIAILGEASPDYRSRHPRGDELLLLVEVSDTTIGHDVTVKRDLYARAAVPEYWVLDLSGRRLIVHRNLAEGRYSQITILAENESAFAACRPENSIDIAAMLP